MKRLFVFAAMWLALASGSTCAQTIRDANNGKFVVLDHVVAVINGEALLESDIDEEMRYAKLEPFQANSGRDTRQLALRRLINRALIEQQMKEQQQFSINISDADVENSLDELRSHLPECAKYDCKTKAGWDAFLATDGLTEKEVAEHWKERLAILRFIDLRFRTGIRIQHESVEDYYAKSVVPAFERQHQQPPPLKDVSARIQELLLQQQVNGLLQDWLRSLRAEGTVRILDPAYATAMDTASDTQEGMKE